MANKALMANILQRIHRALPALRQAAQETGDQSPVQDALRKMQRINKRAEKMQREESTGQLQTSGEAALSEGVFGPLGEQDQQGVAGQRLSEQAPREGELAAPRLPSARNIPREPGGRGDVGLPPDRDLTKGAPITSGPTFEAFRSTDPREDIIARGFTSEGGLMPTDLSRLSDEELERRAAQPALPTLAAGAEFASERLGELTSEISKTIEGFIPENEAAQREIERRRQEGSGRPKEGEEVSDVGAQPRRAAEGLPELPIPTEDTEVASPEAIETLLLEGEPGEADILALSPDEAEAKARKDSPKAPTLEDVLSEAPQHEQDAIKTIKKSIKELRATQPDLLSTESILTALLLGAPEAMKLFRSKTEAHTARLGQLETSFLSALEGRRKERIRGKERKEDVKARDRAAKQRDRALDIQERSAAATAAGKGTDLLALAKALTANDVAKAEKLFDQIDERIKTIRAQALRVEIDANDEVRLIEEQLEARRELIKKFPSLADTIGALRQ